MIKAPTNLKELLELQKILDKKIKRIRTPKLIDITLSAIAETIEFNEECLYSHKNWKTKKIDKVNAIFESIDILFFALEAINWWKREDADGKKAYNKKIETLNKVYTDNYIGILHSELTEFYKNFVEKEEEKEKLLEYYALDLIEMFSTLNFDEFNILEYQYIFAHLVKIYTLLGLNEEAVYKLYFTKWQRNIKRIGKEWN